MEQLILVTRAEVMGDYLLRLTFEDGLVGIVDLAGHPWLGVFEPLRDPAYFCLATVDPELGTAVWPNGADIAPETLYALACGKSHVFGGWAASA